MITLTRKTGFNDGFGAQYQRIIGVYCICKELGLEYLHTSFDDIEYQGLSALEQNKKSVPYIENCNNRIQIKSTVADDFIFDEIIDCDMDKQALIKFKHNNTKNILIRYTLPYIITDKYPTMYRHAKDLYLPKLKKNNKFTIGVHVRRGDLFVVESHRMLSNSYYIDNVMKIVKICQANSLDFIIELYTEVPTKKTVITDKHAGICNRLKKDVEIYPEQNKIEEFDCLPNLKKYINENTLDTFDRMINSDILITSKSSLSTCASYIKKGMSIYCPFWHNMLLKDVSYNDPNFESQITSFIQSYQILIPKKVVHIINSNDNDYFSMFPIYWINMPKRSDRRIRLLKNFSDLNITQHTRITPQPAKKPTESCIYSHYRALQTAYYDEVDYALVIEDDLLLTKECLDKVKETIKLLPDDWDCFQIHYIEPNIIENLLTHKYPNAIIKGYFMAATCYLYNKKGILKFLNTMGLEKSNFKLNEGAIAEQFVYNYVNTYVSLYPMINTKESGSDIQTNDHLNTSNMNLINKFFSTKPDYTINQPIIEFPEGYHWSNTLSNATHALDITFRIKKILYTYLHSGFGNRLFQYYSAWALARKNNLEFAVLGQATGHQNFSYFKDRFPIFPTKDVNQVLKQSYSNRFIIKDSSVIYNENPLNEYTHIDITFNRPNISTYTLNGFFQNEGYIKDYKEEITNEILTNIKKQITWDDTQDLSNTVAIHVRLGDIVKFEKHWVDLTSYYKRSLERLNKKNPNYKFVLVCEYGISEIANHYPYLKDYEKLDYQDEMSDFYFMSQCAGVICANSTFSWWASWLNSTTDKQIFIPNKWLNDRDDILSMEGATVIPV